MHVYTPGREGQLFLVRGPRRYQTDRPAHIIEPSRRQARPTGTSEKILVPSTDDPEHTPAALVKHQYIDSGHRRVAPRRWPVLGDL